jgi:hypothetical protein
MKRAVNITGSCSYDGHLSTVSVTSLLYATDIPYTAISRRSTEWALNKGEEGSKLDCTPLTSHTRGCYDDDINNKP